MLDIITQNVEDNCDTYKLIQNNLMKENILDNIINEKYLNKLTSTEK